MVLIPSQNTSIQHKWHRRVSISGGGLSLIFVHLLETLRYKNLKGGQGDVSNNAFLYFSNTVPFALS